jgi:hypothetical protein
MNAACNAAFVLWLVTAMGIVSFIAGKALGRMDREKKDDKSNEHNPN